MKALTSKYTQEINDLKVSLNDLQAINRNLISTHKAELEKALDSYTNDMKTQQKEFEESTRKIKRVWEDLKRFNQFKSDRMNDILNKNLDKDHFEYRDIYHFLMNKLDEVFTCPIELVRIEEPYILASSGNTVSKFTAEHLHKYKKRDPFEQKTVVDSLIVNRSLKSTMEVYDEVLNLEDKMVKQKMDQSKTLRQINENLSKKLVEAVRFSRDIQRTMYEMKAYYEAQIERLQSIKLSEILTFSENLNYIDNRLVSLLLPIAIVTHFLK